MGRKKKGNVDGSSVLVQLDDEEPQCGPRPEPQSEQQHEPPSEPQPEEQTPLSSKKRRSRKEGSSSNSGSKRNTRSQSGIVTLIPCGSDAAQSAVPQSEKKKRMRTRRSSPEDALSRIKRQVRYFYLRMKSEQNLIDAYSNDGWKGQSREKVRPEKELQKAQAQITKFKLRIREAIHELDKMLLEGSIRESAFDADGQLDYQEIFCASCHTHEAEVDNDIILCDGACNRGFHQRCLTPPLATDDIPPGDEGWLCPACDCKADCVAFLNDHLGTEYEVETNWESFFPEAVSGSGVDDTLKDLGSDESDDDDYDPQSKVEAEKTGAANGEATEEKQPSSSDSSDNEGLENADSGDDDDDFDSEGLSDEDLDQFLKEAEAAANNEEEGSEANGKEIRPEQEEGAENGSANADDSAAGTEAIMSGKRRRRDVDYRKLHDEMFGMGLEPEDGLQSEDEDWGPLKRQSKRNASSSRAARLRPAADADTAADISLDGQPTPPLDDRSKRIPKEAVERLRGAFAENQLPSRTFKEDLSRELGLSYRKVDVWFKNVRCQALRQGLAQPTRACPWKLKQQQQDNGMRLEDSSLLAKLSEVQFKLLDLRRTLQTDLQQKGKRVVYVPEASVVEKQS